MVSRKSNKKKVHIYYCRILYWLRLQGETATNMKERMIVRNSLGWYESKLYM